MRYEVPASAHFTPCQYCGQDITFVITGSGKYMPVTPNGEPHWGDCPGAEAARNGARGSQPLNARTLVTALLADPIERGARVVASSGGYLYRVQRVYWDAKRGTAVIRLEPMSYEVE